MNRILILTDGKAGHENQSRAFARALGCEADVVEMHFKSKFHKALSYLFDHMGIHTLSLFSQPPTARDRRASCAAVIGTGSGTFYAARAVSQRLGVKCGVVLYPRGYRLGHFDCILAPAFDRPKMAPNVIEVPANLVANDAAFYEKGVAAFKARHAGTTNNAVAVIIGGPNKCSTMTNEWTRTQLDKIFAENKGSAMWVTTSRRTPPDVEAVVDAFPWDYKLLYSQDHFNPIPAFVKLAKRLYVTAESTGMLSEACTFGEAEVIALDNLKPGPHKFRRFVEQLRLAGYVDGSRKIDLSAQFARAGKLLARLLILSTVCCTLSACAADFAHSLSETKPWTSENFLESPQEFHFAIVPDRTGGERPGFFGRAMDALNLLRPEFVMSVGDLIDGRGMEETALRKQWIELEKFIGRLQMPFFYVVGNHDIWTGFTGMTPARETSIKLWKELHGTNTYYNFTYKGCHFVCLDSMERHDYFPPREALTQHQVDWAEEEMARHADARWHFIFMHKPLDWTSDRWLAFEKRISRLNYTVFCGDWHNHCTAVRHGKKYYMIGTAGGGFDYGVTQDDLRYGIMDSITWVTVTTNGPVVANLALTGVHGDTIQTCATTKGWVETPLDYPSHLSESPAKYADETNMAMIPTEVMKHPDFDWHFRHAVILRQGRVYQSGVEKFKAGKRRIILLGDETASACAAEYANAQVFDFGFAGDRIENILWRVLQGELTGYAPDEIILSAGRHNRGKNTEREIDAARKRLLGEIRARAPRAKITIIEK